MVFLFLGNYFFTAFFNNTLCYFSIIFKYYYFLFILFFFFFALLYSLSSFSSHTQNQNTTLLLSYKVWILQISRCISVQRMLNTLRDILGLPRGVFIFFFLLDNLGTFYEHTYPLSRHACS